MHSTPLLVESTHGCPQTPHLLVLLDELAAPYELILRPDGYFLATYGRPGPRLIDGELTLFQLSAMLRHCARTRAEGRLLPQTARELARLDAWLELSMHLGLTAFSLAREEREPAETCRPARITEGQRKLAGMLKVLERALDDSDGNWLLGDFGLADCALVSLPRLCQRTDLVVGPRVRAYCERLLSRPSVARLTAFVAAPRVDCCEVLACSNA